MNRKQIAWVLLIPFAALSLYAVSKVGYWGVFDYHRHSPAGWQVFTDLVVALILLLSYIIPDAKKTGRTLWPYLVLTFLLGSFGPLAYIVLGRTQSEAIGKPASA